VKVHGAVVVCCAILLQATGWVSPNSIRPQGILMGKPPLRRCTAARRSIAGHKPEEHIPRPSSCFDLDKIRNAGALFQERRSRSILSFDQDPPTHRVPSQLGDTSLEVEKDNLAVEVERWKKGNAQEYGPEAAELPWRSKK